MRKLIILILTVNWNGLSDLLDYFLSDLFRPNVFLLKLLFGCIWNRGWILSKMLAISHLINLKVKTIMFKYQNLCQKKSGAIFNVFLTVLIYFENNRLTIQYNFPIKSYIFFTIDTPFYNHALTGTERNHHLITLIPSRKVRAIVANLLVWRY